MNKCQQTEGANFEVPVHLSPRLSGQFFLLLTCPYVVIVDLVEKYSYAVVWKKYSYMYVQWVWKDIPVQC